VTPRRELVQCESLEVRVEFCHVKLEGNAFGATIYITGLLANLAATRAEFAIAGLRDGTVVLRVDLRGVEIIDPASFVRVARCLSHWRDLRRGRVVIQFPERSSRATKPSPGLPAIPRLAIHKSTHRSTPADIFDEVAATHAR
jgi:hypothetical protein